MNKSNRTRNITDYIYFKEEDHNMGNVAAFFDIDGTLFRNSLMIEHFKKMIKYEVIDPAIWYGDLRDSFHEWDRRYGEFEDYLEGLAEVYLKELKGINKDYIDFIAS